MTKLSVLLFYRRLVAGLCSRKFKWAVWAAMIFAVVIAFTFLVILITGCHPLSAYWEKYDFVHPISKYHCPSDNATAALGKAAGALSVFSDFYSIMLPAVLLMRIQITRRQKYGLIAIFSVGYL